MRFAHNFSAKKYSSQGTHLEDVLGNQIEVFNTIKGLQDHIHRVYHQELLIGYL